MRVTTIVAIAALFVTSCGKVGPKPEFQPREFVHTDSPMVTVYRSPDLERLDNEAEETNVQPMDPSASSGGKQAVTIKPASARTPNLKPTKPLGPVFH